jgi:hypothetical protein
VTIRPVGNSWSVILASGSLISNAAVTNRDLIQYLDFDRASQQFTRFLCIGGLSMKFGSFRVSVPSSNGGVGGCASSLVTVDDGTPNSPPTLATVDDGTPNSPPTLVAVDGGSLNIPPTLVTADFGGAPTLVAVDGGGPNSALPTLVTADFGGAPTLPAVDGGGPNNHPTW